jgi:hypothetical protein
MNERRVLGAETRPLNDRQSLRRTKGPIACEDTKCAVCATKDFVLHSTHLRPPCASSRLRVNMCRGHSARFMGARVLGVSCRRRSNSPLARHRCGRSALSAYHRTTIRLIFSGILAGEPQGMTVIRTAEGVLRSIGRATV